MKNVFVFLLLSLSGFLSAQGQERKAGTAQDKMITALIDQYAAAREKMDTVLLRQILTPDMDQLVSTGEWREGVDAAVQGMLKSSGNSPGKRTLQVYKIRMLNKTTAIADCKYLIQGDSSIRKMWSTFIVIAEKGKWKISGIRNMLPESQSTGSTR